MNANMIFKWLRDPQFAPDPEMVVDDVSADTSCFLPIEIVDRPRSDDTAAASDSAPVQSAIEIDIGGGQRLRITGDYDPDAWIGKSTVLLEPRADAIGRHMLAGKAIFADDTPIKMREPGTGKFAMARLWAYGRDERPSGNDVSPASWCQFSPDRKGQHPKDHLAKYQGWMHADGNPQTWPADTLARILDDKINRVTDFQPWKTAQ